MKGKAPQTVTHVRNAVFLCLQTQTLPSMTLHKV